MRKQIDRNRIFDFFLLLLAFFSVVGLIQRVGTFGADAGETVSEFTVELIWENVDAQTADCLAEGEILRSENGSIFGTVKKIVRAPQEVILHDEGGEFRKRDPEGPVEEVRLTVAVSGRRSEGILLREGGTAILAGQTEALYSLRAKLFLRVLSA